MKAPWEPMYQPRVAYDGGGGGGPQMAYSNSTSTSGPNPTIAPKLESILQNFWGWYGDNANAPAYYPGATVAGPSRQMQSAVTGLGQRGAAGLGYGLNDAAKRQSLATIQGNYLDPKTNPAFQDFLTASFRPQAELFRDVVAPSLNSTFAGAGRTGGGAHFNTVMRGYEDLARTQSDAAAKAGLGLYQGERDKQFAAMGMLPSFQAMDYQDLQAQAAAGAPEQAYRQQLIDADIAKYNYNKTAQPEWLARMAQIVQGMYPGGQTQGNSSTTSYGGGGGGGGFGSILGAGMGIAGLGLQALPLFGFSDERLKDVEGRVGTTDDGLPLYLYRYKGDDQPRIGPMAQEVAQVKPEAVARHPSGYLAVDYAQLMPEGGLL